MSYDCLPVFAYVHGNVGLRRALDIGADDIITMSPLGSGEHNVNFALGLPGGEKAVLRVNVAAQPFHDDQVSYEYAALTAIEPSGCTPKPLYLDNSPQAPGKGVLVITFCDGPQLDFDALRPGDLRCAAQLMADVHAVAVSEDCPLYRPADPLRALFDECTARFEGYRSSAYEEARITRWAERFISAAVRALDSAGPAPRGEHIVNTETLPSHFLIPAPSAKSAAEAGEVGRFCAHPGSFLDWERPIVGEVAQDIAYFTSPTTTFWDSDFLFPPDDVVSFAEDYWRAVDGRFPRGRFDARFRAWRTMTALRSVTWCCRALISYNGESGAHTTAKTARKLPVYLSDDFMERVWLDCCPQ